jgi:hypothetical protein
MTATRYIPFADKPPGGWPDEYVSADDYDALAARLTEAETYLRWCLKHDLSPKWRQEITAFLTPDSASACRYPDCVDNGPDGKCTDWLTGVCKGPAETVNDT